MSYQLQARDSTYWLNKKDNKKNIGPGTYEVGSKTQNQWNSNPSQYNESRGMNSAMNTGGDDLYQTNPKSEFARRQLIPFNSKIDRDEPDRISM